MIKIIINLLTNLFSVERKTQLGRWKIDKCDKIINRKIYLSNRDNSAPYDNYFKSKQIKRIK